MARSGRWRLFLLLTAAIYAALRFWEISRTCPWFDEIFSVHAAEHTWSGLISFVALDLVHPPLFYAILKLWIAIGGDGVLWLRCLPALISAAGLVPFILLCRELKMGRFASGVALVFFTVNGSLIKYGREVRMYSLLMTLSLTSTWLFVRSMKSGKGFGWLALVNILLVYTHYFGWLIVLSEVAAVSVFYRERWRQMLFVTAATLAAFAPWVVTILTTGGFGSDLGQNIGWMHRPSFGDAAELILNVFEPFYFPLTNLDPASTYLISLPILATILIGLYWNLSRNYDVTNNHGGPARFLMIFAAVPLAVAFAGSWAMPVSFWGTRHLIVVFPALHILTALMIDGIRGKRIRNVVIGALCLLIAAGFAADKFRPEQRFAWCGFGELAAAESASDRALPIYTLEDLAAYTLWFSEKGEVKGRVTKLVGVNGVSEDKAYFLPRGFEDIPSLPIDRLREERILLYFRSPNWDERSGPLAQFKTLGYEIEEYSAYDAGAETAFRVTLVKRQNAAPMPAFPR
jgi:hypothetical protein